MTRKKFYWPKIHIRNKRCRIPNLLGHPVFRCNDACYRWCLALMIFEKGIMKKLEKKGGNKTVVLMATNNAFEYKPFEKFFLKCASNDASTLILIKYWWHKELCYVPDGPKCTGIHPIHVPMYPPEFDNACGRHSKWFTQQHNTTSQCLKIIQNVAFEFLYFGIFRQFLSFRIYLSGSTIWPQASVFKNSPKLTIFGIFNHFL